jgi:hypothetical protein
MSLCKNCGRWKNFDCIFEFSMKGYVRKTINLSCAKILLPSVIIASGICCGTVKIELSLFRPGQTLRAPGV